MVYWQHFIICLKFLLLKNDFFNKLKYFNTKLSIFKNIFDTKYFKISIENKKKNK